MSNAAPEILNRTAVATAVVRYGVNRATAATCVNFSQDLEDEADRLKTMILVSDERLRARVAELETAFLRACSEVRTVTEERDAARIAEMRNYLASPAMATFGDLKHSQAGTVLAMLGDGAISRGKCCEVLAQLAHGVPFDEIPLPEEKGRQFSEDEIPAEVVEKLEAEVSALRAELERLKTAIWPGLPKFVSTPEVPQQDFNEAMIESFRTQHEDDQSELSALQAKLEAATKPRGYELTQRWSYEVSCETNVDGRGRPDPEWHPKDIFDWNHNPEYATKLRADDRCRNVVLKRREVTSGCGPWEEIAIDAAMQPATSTQPENEEPK